MAIGLRQRRKRLKRERDTQRKRFRRNPKGSRKRGRAKARLREIAVGLDKVRGQIKDLADRGLARQPIDWNGCEPLGSRRLRKLARLVTVDPQCYITSTTGGVHAPGSWHYLKRALDWGSNDPTNRAEGDLQNRMYERFGARFFLELFGPRDWYVKNRVRYTGQFPAHDDHGHGAA